MFVDSCRLVLWSLTKEKLWSGVEFQSFWCQNGDVLLRPIPLEVVICDLMYWMGFLSQQNVNSSLSYPITC